MADEPTLGELGRRLDDRFGELRQDLAEVRRSLDKKVDVTVYQIQHDALRDRLAALEALRAQDAARVAATRRWLIGAVVMPVVAILLAYILSKGGSG